MYWFFVEKRFEPLRLWVRLSRQPPEWAIFWPCSFRVEPYEGQWQSEMEMDSVWHPPTTLHHCRPSLSPFYDSAELTWGLSTASLYGSYQFQKTAGLYPHHHSWLQRRAVCARCGVGRFYDCCLRRWEWWCSYSWFWRSYLQSSYRLDSEDCYVPTH